MNFNILVTLTMLMRLLEQKPPQNYPRIAGYLFSVRNVFCVMNFLSQEFKTRVTPIFESCLQSSSANQDGVFCYQPHCRPVKQLSVAPLQPDNLYSCSYDGLLRCCNLEHATFHEVCNFPCLCSLLIMIAHVLSLLQWCFNSVNKTGSVARITRISARVIHQRV